MMKRIVTYQAHRGQTLSQRDLETLVYDMQYLEREPNKTFHRAPDVVVQVEPAGTNKSVGKMKKITFTAHRW